MTAAVSQSFTFDVLLSKKDRSSATTCPSDCHSRLGAVLALHCCVSCALQCMFFYLFFLIAAHLYQFEILDLLPNLFTKEKGTHQSSR
jgi:hypothetical protein